MAPVQIGHTTLSIPFPPAPIASPTAPAPATTPTLSPLPSPSYTSGVYTTAAIYLSWAGDVPLSTLSPSTSPLLRALSSPLKLGINPLSKMGDILVQIFPGSARGILYRHFQCAVRIPLDKGDELQWTLTNLRGVLEGIISEEDVDVRPLRTIGAQDEDWDGGDSVEEQVRGLLEMVVLEASFVKRTGWSTLWEAVDRLVESKARLGEC